jgi:hypothetical protein
LLFETKSHCAGQAALELTTQPRLASNVILLAWPPEGWDDRHAPSCLTPFVFLISVLLKEFGVAYKKNTYKIVGI